ncbi:MAG: type II toxin-antitoxin system PemK/MazF family toxin [Desulfamplus sp.]|nr:type II toxin-antitoxin system PemK/MazF family toxin [Desulfamplus sp.]
MSGQPIKRGDIWWVRLDPVSGREQRGLRPVLVVSENSYNLKSGTPIGMALTSQRPKAGFPFTQELQWKGLKKPSWVKISQIRILDEGRFENKIGQISQDKVEEILQGLDMILDRQKSSP